MATYTNENLIFSKFMDPVSYTTGRGRDTKVERMYNFFDNKLMFLEDTYNCIVYTVQQPVFLPNLSVRFYNTSSLWWVIARYNGIIFPLKEVEIGTILYIPELSAITKAINNSKSKTSTGSSYTQVTI